MEIYFLNYCKNYLLMKIAPNTLCLRRKIMIYDKILITQYFLCISHSLCFRLFNSNKIYVKDVR